MNIPLLSNPTGSSHFGLVTGSNTFSNRAFSAIKPEWNDLSVYTTGVIPSGIPMRIVASLHKRTLALGGGRGTTAFSVSRNLVEGDYLEAGLELTIFGTYRIANNAVLKSATHSFADKLGVSRLLYATESITTLFSDY